MQHQLYLYRGLRDNIIERHDFYVEQVKKRLFSAFQNIEEEAETYANETYDRMGRYASEYDDPALYAEAAHDAAIDHMWMLGELHKQVILGALAGMYHQWDKELRDFITRELRYTTTEETERTIWKVNSNELFDLLKDFRWDCRTEVFYPALDASRLIVNVYKHGNGKALEDLARKYPAYLFGYKPAVEGYTSRLDHEMLTVSEDQFEELAVNVRLFWEAFPERNYYRGE